MGGEVGGTGFALIDSVSPASGAATWQQGWAGAVGNRCKSFSPLLCTPCACLWRPGFKVAWPRTEGATAQAGRRGSSNGRSFRPGSLPHPTHTHTHIQPTPLPHRTGDSCPAALGTRDGSWRHGSATAVPGVRSAGGMNCQQRENIRGQVIRLWD